MKGVKGVGAFRSETEVGSVIWGKGQLKQGRDQSRRNNKRERARKKVMPGSCVLFPCLFM